MASPKLEPLVLSRVERETLEGWARRATAQQLVLRSRIVLACADGASVSAVAGELGVTRVTAARWRSRFLSGRLDGLADERRSGRPRTITDERVVRVVTVTQSQEPPEGTVRWSTRSMARHAGMSPTAIGRIWRAFGLKPHLARNEKRESMMLAAERRDVLLGRLARDGKLVARDVAAELGLSDDSIRRDLRDMAAAGLCQRVYGGALPVSPALGTTHATRSGISQESKERIAARAARLITPGSTVILDGGTTALEVVAALPPDLDATIITHSATTAEALTHHPTVNVVMLSGRLLKRTLVTSGAVAAEAASSVTADLALLTMPGVHPAEGLTAGEAEDAAMKRILASRATETYAMTSAEKLGTASAYKILGFSEVAGIITDAPASHPIIQQLRDQQANIIQCDELPFREGFSAR